MDVSQEYIKMCEKFYEGRALWEPQSGDFVYCQDNKKVVVLYFNKHHGNPPYKYTHKNISIPLFRQDQLQEMMKLEFPNLMDYSHDRYYSNLRCYGFHKSFEQFWLAFVMKERYQKVWNGKDWIMKEG